MPRPQRINFGGYSKGPIDLPTNWPKLVHDILPSDQADKLTNSLIRPIPLGQSDWTQKAAKKMNLQSTLNPKGRPRNGTGHLLIPDISI